LHVAIRALERSETFVQRRLAGRRFASELLTWEVVEKGLVPCCPVHLESPCESSSLVRRWPHIATLVRQSNLLRTLRRLRPDIVHAHFGPAGGRIALPCTVLRIPLVVSYYGFDAGARAEGIRGRSEIAAMQAANATFTAEGSMLARRLIELGARPDRVKLLPLCLPAWALGEPERIANSWSAELRLLQVARFVEKKGIDTTLLAVAEARRRGIPVHLTLVGDGELRAQLERLAADNGLREAVTWMGFQPYEALPALLARAHAFIQPSRTARDGDTEGGYPTTLIEAMAQGLPVLGTRHADIPLVVRHGETGLLSAEGDSSGLAEAIAMLHRSRERLQYMSARAREVALRRHDPQAMLALRERIYRNALHAAGKDVRSAQ
jgi:colanic acid/amylovoran biosynthesis glycosyltransferase